MRNAMLAILALLAAGTAAIGRLRAGRGYDYPYCVQGRGVGVPGDCSYSSYAPMHGVAPPGAGLYCNVNPRVAFGAAAAGSRPASTGIIDA